MIEIKIYECAICNRLVENKVKGEKKFFGTRKDVRKHLQEVHHMKGHTWKNKSSREDPKKYHSRITKETLIHGSLK